MKSRILFFSFLIFSCNLFAQDFFAVAYVLYNGEWCIIDRQGNFLTENLFEHDSLFTECFSDGMVLMEKNYKYGFINLANKKIIPCKYNSAMCFENKICSVKKNGKWLMIDEEGKEIKPVDKKTTEETNTKPDYEIVDINGLTNCKSRSGKLLLEKPNEFVAPWNDVNSFLNDRVICLKIEMDKTCTCHRSINYYGFINCKGDWVIEPQYLSADVFRNGLSVVSTADGYGYIDTNGHWFIAPKFEAASSFYMIKFK